MKSKKIFLMIIISILCTVFCSCTSTKKFQISNAYSRDGEFLYFSTPYSYTAYYFTLSYVYKENESCSSYEFIIKNKDDKKIDDLDISINGVKVSSSSRPYLTKYDTISTQICITSSALPMINTANDYAEFIVELYDNQDSGYTVLARAEFTFEQVKQLCSSKND